MAIGTDALVDFFGTEDEVSDTSPGTIADAAYSAEADCVDWTNDDDVREARMRLRLRTAPAADYTDNSTIIVFAQLKDLDGTVDEPVPATDYERHPIGAFIVKGNNALQELTCTVRLPNIKTSQVYRFYLKNNTGQTIAVSTAVWDLYIIPITGGPKA